MRTKPELKSTRDYTIFELHELNRPLHDDPVLFESMKKHGWLPSSPAQVIQSGPGRYKVVRGHHRLDIAKRLKIAVWYVVDETTTDPWDLEGCRSAWTLSDFAVGKAANGDKHLQAVLEFKRKHGITLLSAASLLGGESAGSNNKARLIKTGGFKVADDLSHAKRVVAVVDKLRDLGIEFAGSAAFVSAISRLIWVPEFEPDILIHKVRLNKSLLEKRGTVEKYLDVIESTYNFAAKKPIPLAFRAREVGKKRKESFGRNNGLYAAKVAAHMERKGAA